MSDEIKNSEIDKAKELQGENPDFGDSWWAPIALMAVLGFRNIENVEKAEEY